MKNTIKRILLLLPVISVLLVALAVPVFAEATDGGYIVDSTFQDCYYAVSGSSNRFRTIDVTLDTPVSLEGGVIYKFSYFLEIDVASLIDASFDIPSEYVFIMGIKQNDNDPSFNFTRGSSRDGSLVAVNLLQVPDGIYSTIPYDLQTATNVFILCNEDLFPYLTDVDYTYYTIAPPPADELTSVWTEIMTWITSALNSVMGAFYVDGSLTLLGTLACIGVSVGICFLLIGLIQRFLHLRG